MDAVRNPRAKSEPAAGFAKSATVTTAETMMPPVIAAAIVKVQKGLEPLLKTANNSEYGSTYVPLPEVMTKAIELLNKHGVAVMQPPVTDRNGHLALRTMLIHKSGVGWATTTRLALEKPNPQGHVSAITYTRRAALMGTLGFTAEDEDDDGNKASGVMLKVTDEQLDRIRSLLMALRFSREQVAKEVFNIKTSDHADLAILNYEKLISMQTRDNESKARATKIEVGDPKSDDDSAGGSTGPGQGDLNVEERISNLGLRDKATENKFVWTFTEGNKPFLKNCTAADLEELGSLLDLIESGKRALPNEWYAAGHPPVRPDVSEPREPGEETS